MCRGTPKGRERFSTGTEVIRVREILGFVYLVAFDLAVNAMDVISAATVDVREWLRTDGRGRGTDDGSRTRITGVKDRHPTVR